MQNASIEISEGADLIINHGVLGRGTNWLFPRALVLLPGDVAAVWVMFEGWVN